MPPAFQYITWKVYVIFAVFCASMFIHVFFLFPETANKPLEEVAQIFDYSRPGTIKYIGTPAWRTKNYHSHAVKAERNQLSSEKLSGPEHDKREEEPQA